MSIQTPSKQTPNLLFGKLMWKHVLISSSPPLDHWMKLLDESSERMFWTNPLHESFYWTNSNDSVHLNELVCPSLAGRVGVGAWKPPQAPTHMHAGSRLNYRQDEYHRSHKGPDGVGLHIEPAVVVGLVLVHRHGQSYTNDQNRKSWKIMRANEQLYKKKGRAWRRIYRTETPVFSLQSI